MWVGWRSFVTPLMSEVLRRLIVEYVKGMLSRRIGKVVASMADRDAMVDQVLRDLDKLREAFAPFKIPDYDGHEPMAAIPDIVELIRCKENMVVLNFKKLRCGRGAGESVARGGVVQAGIARDGCRSRARGGVAPLHRAGGSPGALTAAGTTTPTQPCTTSRRFCSCAPTSTRKLCARTRVLGLGCFAPRCPSPRFFAVGGGAALAGAQPDPHAVYHERRAGAGGARQAAAARH